MAVTLTESITYKRLVAAGNDKIFYEDLAVAAGTMTELDTSGGAIDTSDQLQMFEAYQKVFVVNGANLKIADFVNTKLTVTALTTAPTRGEVVTQLTSGATMIVDFVNTAKTEIYGYVNSGTFVTTADYTLSGGSMDPTTRVPSAVTANPHWYDYTVYPGGTFGELPSKAYLGCLYRGRVVLSGNPDKPFQWYMSRQANPFDRAWAANDSQSPVEGGNSDAGELGVIVRALIPFKDDYLVFGCASQMWLMTGDPAFGGVINEMSLTTGIFGANSWCFDNQDRMYFWGNNGIYRTTVPGNPVCISNVRLPDLVGDKAADKAADPSTHRITMVYDRDRHGINICVTKLSDGTNSNYWYDLRVIDDDDIGGFFPESYPEECGVYSAFYYNANSPTYKGMLYGCKDGYIRTFKDASKSDDIGATDEAISSYVTIGPIRPAGVELQGIVSGINVVLSGGASAGSQTDSSNVTMKIFSALSAENLIEKMYANTAPRLSTTIIAPGRQRGATVQRKMRDAFFGIRLENSTAAQSWSLEELTLLGTPSGRIK